MPLDCTDIHEIVDSDFNCRFSEEWFLEHVEFCSNCRKLFELRPELEERLINLLPQAAPAELSNQLLSIIHISERVTQLQKIKEIVLGMASVLSFAILAILVLLNRGILSSLASFAGIRQLAGEAAEFIKPLEILKSQLADGLILITSSPLLLATLVASIVLVWSFCILKFRETIK